MTEEDPGTKGLDWVGVVQRLRTIAGEGLAYSENPYDRDRDRRLAELADEVVTAQTGSLASDGEAVRLTVAPETETAPGNALDSSALRSISPYRHLSSAACA
jgi:hypothetical protein